MGMKVADVHKLLVDFKTEVLSEIQVIKDAVMGIESLSRRVATMESKIQEMEKAVNTRLDDIEGQARRNNMIVYGLAEEGQESWEDTEVKVRAFFKEDMGVQEVLSIERCHRLGPKRRGHTSRPIILKFSFFKDKTRVMKKASTLKGKAISVSDDFTRAVRARRKLLVPHLKYFRNKNKKASISLDKLNVEGVTFVVNEEREVVNQRTGEKINYGALEPEHGGN